MNTVIAIEPLTREAFAPYGDIIDTAGEPDKLINDGWCARYHDRARLDFGEGGRAGISVFHGQPYALPHTLTLVERHPQGSQAFMPLSSAPFLVIVAGDKAGTPVFPRAFMTEAGQGVNIHRNVWHGVLTPLNEAATFAVVDWIGDAANLEEHRFERPFVVK